MSEAIVRPPRRGGPRVPEIRLAARMSALPIVALVLTAASVVLLGRAMRSQAPRHGSRSKRWALAVASMLATATAWLACSEPSDAASMDRALLAYVRDAVPSGWTGFFAGITRLGSSWVLAPLAAVLAAVAWRAGRRDASLVLATTVASAVLLGPALKALTGRVRPDAWAAVETWGSSFPSGHTLVSTVFAGALAWVTSRHWPASRHVGPLLAAAFALLVGLSRLVLGVHWPSDVAASWCLGLLVVVLAGAAAPPHPRRDIGSPPGGR